MIPPSSGRVYFGGGRLSPPAAVLGGFVVPGSRNRVHLGLVAGSVGVWVVWPGSWVMVWGGYRLWWMWVGVGLLMMGWSGSVLS